MRHHHHDDDDEHHGKIIRDGEVVRVPLHLMDAAFDPVQRAIARNGLHDGAGNMVGHRPGAIHDASDVDGAERRRRMYRQYDAEKAREYLGDARKVTQRDPQGRVQSTFEEEDDDELRDASTLTLDQIETRHQQNMARQYAAYDARVREMWRNP